MDPGAEAGASAGPRNPASERAHWDGEERTKGEEKKGSLGGVWSVGLEAEESDQQPTGGEGEHSLTPPAAGRGSKRAARVSAGRVKSRKAAARLGVTGDLRSAAGSPCSSPASLRTWAGRGRWWAPNRMEASDPVVCGNPRFFEARPGNRHVAQGRVQGQAMSRQPCLFQAGCSRDRLGCQPYLYGLFPASAGPGPLLSPRLHLACLLWRPWEPKKSQPGCRGW